MNDQEIKEGMEEIPFGNTEFQIRCFSGKNQGVARKIRYHLLQLRVKENSRENTEIELDQKQINIDEAEYKIKIEKDIFEIRRLKLVVKKNITEIKHISQLLADNKREIEIHRDELKNLPAFNRSEFEKEELGYWQRRLLTNAKHQLISSNTIKSDTIRALEDAGVHISRDKRGVLIPDEFKEFFLIDKLQKLE